MLLGVLEGFSGEVDLVTEAADLRRLVFAETLIDARLQKLLEGIGVVLELFGGFERGLRVDEVETRPGEGVGILSEFHEDGIGDCFVAGGDVTAGQAKIGVIFELGAEVGVLFLLFLLEDFQDFGGGGVALFGDEIEIRLDDGVGHLSGEVGGFGLIVDVDQVVITDFGFDAFHEEGDGIFDAVESCRRL